MRTLRVVVLMHDYLVPPETAKTEFTVVLTVQTMNYLHSGRHRVVL